MSNVFDGNPSTRTRSDKVQPGNPHRLVLRQHVYPRASIARFVDARGGVELADFKRAKVRRAKPDDAMFCADRAWSNGAETGWMKGIEDAFQSVAQLVMLNATIALGLAEELAVRRFYTLWHARAERRHLQMQYIRPNGVLAPSILRTDDEIETLEKNGCMTMRADGSFAFRDLNTAHISIRMGRLHEALQREPWGVVVSHDADFCVPDQPAHGIIPVSPSIALIRNTPSGRVTRDNVRQINSAMQTEASGYVFARSLSACPGVGSSIR